MSILRVLLSRLKSVAGRRGYEQDLDDDIQAHLDLLTDEHIARGMTPEDARAAARREFGGIEQMKEVHRDHRGFPFIDTLFRDVRHTLRGLRRSPVFTVVAVMSLAVGIGINAAVFPVVDSLILGMRLPVRQPDRLVDIYTSAKDGSSYSGTSYPDYLDFKQRSTTLADVAAYSPSIAAIKNGDQSRVAMGEIVSGNYFRLLGVNAVVGRTLLPEDDRAGAPRVAVISDRVWQKEFDASPAVVGRTIHIHGQPYVIVGVMPHGFTGVTSILPAEVWTSITFAQDIERFGISEVVPSPDGTGVDRRGYRWLFLKGRLKDRETVASAAANLQAIMSELASEYSVTDKGRHIDVMLTEDVRIHPAANNILVAVSGALWILAGLALLVTCANVAGMLLARSSQRRNEIAVRLAIGGSRARIIQQILTEALVLSVAGAVAGALLAETLLQAISAVHLPTLIPISLEVGLSSRALWYTAGMSLLAGIIAGIVPALRSTRPGIDIKIKGDVPLRLRRWWQWPLRDGLVTLQVAIALVLLVVGALLTRSALVARGVEAGFQASGVAAVAVPLNLIGYDQKQAQKFFDRASERIRSLPGVENVAWTARPPLDLNINTDLISFSDRPAADDNGSVTWTTIVSPEYFDALKIPLVEGRNFNSADTPDSTRVAIVNQSLARRYWPHESAIGKRFRVIPADGPDFEIVGISADYKVVRMGEPPTPYIHFAVSQNPSPAWVLLARGRGDAGQLVNSISRELVDLEPNLILPSNRTMQGLVDTVLLPAQFAALGVAAVAAIAMLLAAVGLYGVIAYSVESRTREIGIRIALGAKRSQVVGMVMRQGLKVAALGVAVGAILAGAAARLIARALYGVIHADDPVSWGSAVVVLLVTTLLANSIPARRAARIEPAIALRNE